jgi:hypothetical protein
LNSRRFRACYPEGAGFVGRDSSGGERTFHPGRIAATVLFIESFSPELKLIAVNNPSRSFPGDCPISRRKALRFTQRRISPRKKGAFLRENRTVPCVPSTLFVGRSSAAQAAFVKNLAISVQPTRLFKPILSKSLIVS